MRFCPTSSLHHVKVLRTLQQPCDSQPKRSCRFLSHSSWPSPQPISVIETTAIAPSRATRGLSKRTSVATILPLRKGLLSIKQHVKHELTRFRPGLCQHPLPSQHADRSVYPVSVTAWLLQHAPFPCPRNFRTLIELRIPPYPTSTPSSGVRTCAIP